MAAGRKPAPRGARRVQAVIDRQTRAFPEEVGRGRLGGPACHTPWLCSVTAPRGVRKVAAMSAGPGVMAMSARPSAA